MSKLHTNNHGEVDSIFDAANYSYFSKRAIVSWEFARSVSSKYSSVFFLFFLFISLNDATFYASFWIFMKPRVTKSQSFLYVVRMCETVNNVQYNKSQCSSMLQGRERGREKGICNLFFQIAIHSIDNKKDSNLWFV